MPLKIARLTFVVWVQYSLTSITLSYDIIIIIMNPVVYATVKFGQPERNRIHRPPTMITAVEVTEVVFSTLSTNSPPLLFLQRTGRTPAAYTNLLMLSSFKIYFCFGEYSFHTKRKSCTVASITAYTSFLCNIIWQSPPPSLYLPVSRFTVHLIVKHFQCVALRKQG